MQPIKSISKSSRYKQKGTHEKEVDIPEEGRKEISRIGQAEMSGDDIIQKLQVGDYHNAKLLYGKLMDFNATKDEKKIISDIKLSIEDYIKGLPYDKQIEIKKELEGNNIPGGKAVSKYVTEKMSKLNKYSEFTRSINEQSAVNATNYKTVDFASLMSTFENLAGKKEQLNDDERTLLNDVRSEIQSRYTKLGGK